MNMKNVLLEALGNALQIQEYVAKPEQLRQIAFQKRNRKTSVFLDNFYRNVPQHESAVDIDKTTIPG